MKRTVCYLALSAACALASCLKEGKYDMTYILNPGIQTQSVGSTEPLEGVIAYAYDVDTLDWGIASYADAAAGIITRKDDPARKLTEPTVIATPYDGTIGTETEGTDFSGTAGWLQMPFGKTVRMVVAVDPSTRLYGYTMQQPQLNLERLYDSVVFQPWREGFVYKNNAWSFYNEFYTPPTVLKTYCRPVRQAEEGAAEEAFTAQQIKAYAYVADTTDWYIASYDDAVAGKITRKEGTDTRTTPNFQAYYESVSGLYGMEVTATPLMAVVVDRVDRIYAYTKFVPDLDGESPTWPVVFRPWRALWKYEEGDWRMVDERQAPKQ